MRMIFPRRSMRRTACPVRSCGSGFTQWRSTRDERNSAETMRRPVSRGEIALTIVSTSGSSGIRAAQQDLISLHNHRNGLHGNRRIVVVLSSQAIKLPRMPRTHKLISMERSLAERSALMRTNSAHRVKLSVHVADRKRFAAGINLPHITIGKGGKLSNFAN